MREEKTLWLEDQNAAKWNHEETEISRNPIPVAPRGPRAPHLNSGLMR